MVMIFQFDLKKAEISLCKMEVQFNALEEDIYEEDYYSMSITFKIDDFSKREFYKNEVDLRIRPRKARDGWVKATFSTLVLNLVSLMKLDAKLADTIQKRWDSGIWDNRRETRLSHKNTGSVSSLVLLDADVPYDSYDYQELGNIDWDVAAIVSTILQFTETVGDTTTASLPLPADSEDDYGVNLSPSAKGKGANFMLATGYPFPSTPDKVVAYEDVNGGGASAAKRFRSAASFHDMTLQ